MTNAIGVLSRADEIGAGRLDALISARRVARRYSADPMLRQLCQTVVPVAGLLAETGRTLRQDEYLLLEALAELPKAQTEDMLLSVDRFIRTAVTGGPAPDVRMALLDRFGLFGVRLSLVLLRAGLADASALAEELLNRSGLGGVRQLLANQFAERRTVLKARSAVLAMERTVRAHPMRRAQGLSDAVQRILAGAHEFRELQLLRVLRLPELELVPGRGRGGRNDCWAAPAIALSPLRRSEDATAAEDSIGCARRNSPLAGARRESALGQSRRRCESGGRAELRGHPRAVLVTARPACDQRRYRRSRNHELDEGRNMVTSPPIMNTTIATVPSWT